MSLHEPNIASLAQNINGIEIIRRDGAIMVSSRRVAEDFGKEHAKVLRAIRNLECSKDFTDANFGVSEYLDATGRSLPQMLMTRDGFTFLVMGFTGKEAAVWKERYIAAFNAMETQLRQQPAILSGPQLLAAALIEADATMKLQAVQIEAMRPKVEAFDRLDTATGNLTVRPASKVLGVPEGKLIRWLEINRWAFRQNGKGPLQAYVDKKQSGYLDHKLSQYTDQHTGDEKVSITLVITPKGLAKLAALLAKDLSTIA